MGAPSAKREEVFADVSAWSADALIRLLRKYRLRRSGIDIDNLSRDWCAWQLFPPAEEAARAPPVPSSGPADAGAAAWFPDPRLPALGFRALVPAGEVPPGGAEGGGDCGAFRALTRMPWEFGRVR